MGDPVTKFLQKLLLGISCLFLSTVSSAELLATPIPSVSPVAANLANKNFNRLAEILPFYEHALIVPWSNVPETSHLLKRGSHHSAVILLRARLQATNDLSGAIPGSNFFDKNVEDAVKLFQWRHGLKADGVVGAGTRAALNVSPEMRVQQIRINMQRWAALANALGSRYLLINIPEFQLHVVEDDKDVLLMKVIVGKPSRQTPELTSRVTRIVFNPKWNVPAMIAKNDIVPKVMENPAYLNNEGIRIFNNDQNDSYELSRRDIDWKDAKENGFPYHFRQDPGVKNALGLVKFEFQNSHDVYMHDTPAKALFANDVRDFSSGCIRLEKPFALVDYLTKNDDRINGDEIKATLASRKTTYFRVAEPLPLIVAYLTAWVDDKGYPHFADDIYHLDNPDNASAIPQDTANGSGAKDDDSDDNDAPPSYRQSQYSTHEHSKYDDRFQAPANEERAPMDDNQDRWPPDPGL